ncbi:hypothetical protein B0H14DRAFT_3543569 [Mycena olivaceomarginata]|nr:hypothetical protein B0H14DRAFT_3543569 [Mycena olivaceomarginata]
MPIQKLTFKPSLTQEEHATLVAEFGSVNPIVAYLEKRKMTTLSGIAPKVLKSKAKTKKKAGGKGKQPQPRPRKKTKADSSDSDTDIYDSIIGGPLPNLTDSENDDDDNDNKDDGGADEEDINLDINFVDLLLEIATDCEDPKICLTLIRDPQRARIKTCLCKSGDGLNWTVLKPPRSTAVLKAGDEPRDRFWEMVDSVRWNKTLRRVKENTKLYTVGPMDFCGHAKVYPVGRGMVVAPCHWHPSLTNAQQLWEDRCWKSIGTWKVGIQKLSKKGMRTEIALRTATRKALRLAGKAFADSDVTLEVRRKKSVKTLAARVKAIKAAGAAAKKKKKTIAVQKLRVPLPSADIVFKTRSADEGEIITWSSDLIHVARPREIPYIIRLRTTSELDLRMPPPSDVADSPNEMYQIERLRRATGSHPVALMACGAEWVLPGRWLRRACFQRVLYITLTSSLMQQALPKSQIRFTTLLKIISTPQKGMEGLYLSLSLA